MRCDDATNMHRRERYRNYGRKYLKENFIRKISSQTEKTQYNLQQRSGVEYVDWTHPAQDDWQSRDIKQSVGKKSCEFV